MPFASKEDKREYQLAWIKARREEWINENGPCKRCGSKENLEVDHKDKSSKGFAVASVWSLAKTNPKRINELAKCQVLCKTCHALKNNDENYNRSVPHGTGSGYTYHHCRCDLCKEYKRLYDRQYRATQNLTNKTNKG